MNLINSDIHNNVEPITQVLDNLSIKKPDSTTENGDPCFSHLGNYSEEKKNILSNILELKQSLVGNVENDIVNVVNKYWNDLVSEISKLESDDKNELIVYLFKLCFFTRNIRGQGNRSRIQFYTLFKELRRDFPLEAISLVKLIPTYGYFRDIDNLINAFENDQQMKFALLSVYISSLKSDLNVLLKEDIDTIDLASLNLKLDGINKNLKEKSTKEIFDFVKEISATNLSLAGKWVKRENKKNSSHRDDLIYLMFPTIKPGNAKGLTMGRMILRKAASSLSQCLNVIEQYMTDATNRGWGDIEVLTSLNVTKYRKALLNIDSYGSERTEREDRRKCKQKILKKIMDDKLNGSQLDIKKLADYIWRENFTCDEEKLVLSAQWKQMVNYVRNLIDETIEKDRKLRDEAKQFGDEELEPISDPRNCIPVVDVSGSMSGANVMQYSIALGILCSSISKIPGKLITFSDEPEVFSFDPNKDIFELFNEIRRCGWGGSTNLDATFKLLLGEMVNARKNGLDISVNFSLLILTDGQFNEMVDYDESENGGHKSFHQRQEKMFKDSGFSVPVIIYWNLATREVGFPVQSDQVGVKLVSGFSQTIMVEVMSGDYSKTIDDKVDVNPLDSFIKTMNNDSLKEIENILKDLWSKNIDVKEAW